MRDRSKSTDRQRTPTLHNGQITVEYAVMFAVIVVVILASVKLFFEPTINNFFRVSTKIIDSGINRIENVYSF